MVHIAETIWFEISCPHLSQFVQTGDVCLSDKLLPSLPLDTGIMSLCFFLNKVLTVYIFICLSHCLPSMYLRCFSLCFGDEEDGPAWDEKREHGRAGQRVFSVPPHPRVTHRPHLIHYLGPSFIIDAQVQCTLLQTCSLWPTYKRRQRPSKLLPYMGHRERIAMMWMVDGNIDYFSSLRAI